MTALTAELFGRFARRVVTTDDGCCEWTAAVDPTGYGRFHLAGRMAYAHRVAYTWAHGPIPAGFDVDHLCRNRRCVNPAHLEAVSRRVNLLRGATLALAHHRGVHCGNQACPGCKRKQMPAGAVA